MIITSLARANRKPEAYSQDSRGLPGNGPQNNATLFQRLLSVPYTTPPWSTEYPSLATILQNNPNAPEVLFLAIFFYHTNFSYQQGDWVQQNVACGCPRFGAVSTDALPYTKNVTFGNWVDANATMCLQQIFVNWNSGDLGISATAPFLGNITFTEVPWPRIGLGNPYYPLPSYLPGLRESFPRCFSLRANWEYLLGYGNITTPVNPDTSSSASSLSGFLHATIRNIELSMQVWIW